VDNDVIQTGAFKAEARKNGLSLDDIRLIELAIMSDPHTFPLMSGTNGLRKMRFSPSNRNTGKSGGVRVCYFVIDRANHIYLVTIFAKNEKDNLNAADKHAVSEFIAKTKRLYEEKGSHP
jgi:hypothetical protein